MDADQRRYMEFERKQRYQAENELGLYGQVVGFLAVVLVVFVLPACWAYSNIR